MKGKKEDKGRKEKGREEKGSVQKLQLFVESFKKTVPYSFLPFLLSFLRKLRNF